MKSLKESILGKQNLNKITDNAKELIIIKRIITEFIKKHYPKMKPNYYEKDSVMSPSANMIDAIRLVYDRCPYGTFVDVKNKSLLEIRESVEKLIKELQESLSKYGAQLKCINDNKDKDDYNDYNVYNIRYHLVFTVDNKEYILQFNVEVYAAFRRVDPHIVLLDMKMNKDLLGMIFPDIYAKIS